MSIRPYHIFLGMGVVSMLIDTWSMGLSGFICLLLMGLTLYKLVHSLSSITSGAGALISFLAVFQLLAAPWIFYKNFDGTQLANLFHINMMVPHGEYFALMLPAVSFFTAGVFAMRMKLVERSSLPDQKIAKAVFIIGLLAYVIHRFNLIGSLSSSFLWLLLMYFLPSGLLMLHALKLYKFPRRRVFQSYPLWGFVFWLLTEASGSGMFGNLVFWGFMATVITLRQRPVSLPGRIALILVAFFSVGVLQLAKSIYRTEAWTTGNASIQVLLQSFGQGFSETIEGASEAEQMHTVFRLNQGWHVSHVIKRCQDESIMLLGEKTFESLFVSFIPRVLWPSKPKAGGRENIEKFTYINLTDGTSMNISFFGDFLVDFGKRGLPLALLLFGLAMGYIFQAIERFAEPRAFVAVTFPIILVGMLQIETDLMMLANHGAKSFVLLWAISGIIDGYKKAPILPNK
jgi:hypothetical protein